MVNFNKKLKGSATASKPIDPEEIYEKADRASDTGPLRPAQISVLREWHGELRKEKDVIVKMHTGQGKTLIGLLILKSKLNETGEPALYICPNTYLVQQTVAQAKRFGIKCCTAEKELPEAFIDGEQILVMTVQKLFNGMTKFGLGPHSQTVGSIVLDDCHACIDAIHQGVKITLPRTHHAYQALFALFSSDLKEQGAGTYAEIELGAYKPYLPIPYWAWTSHQSNVAAILAKHVNTDEIKYAWPLIKDDLQHCTCIISGSSIEIEPHLPPLDLFGSYSKAGHRVFMSATVTNDAFLVKGLGLQPSVIEKPVVDKKERWSGEKLILIPSLIDASLGRDFVVKTFGKVQPTRKYGVVAITPSFKIAEDWEKAGAILPKTGTIWKAIDDIKQGQCAKALVIANRYDGIDLPDRTCRLLVIDSKPQGETLTDRWMEECRSEGEVTLIRMARTIEQGLGRSVRGEKDYSVIILTGPELVKQLRHKKTRGYFSAQTQMQLQIGLNVVEFAKEDIAGGKAADEVLKDLMNQCLLRDAGWKDYYNQQMAALGSSPMAPKALGIFAVEQTAEKTFQTGKPEAALKLIQDLVDKEKIMGAERGWYLQEMARYVHAYDKDRSNELQIAAHRANPYLLKPRNGMVFEPITAKGQKRIERIISWAKEFASPEDLLVELDAITNNLRFGVEADDFEASIDQLGKALGFAANRPEKEQREGPDNLWALRDDLYLIIECKNKVELDRKEVNKSETGQMNNACAWFAKRYPGAKNRNLIVIWTKLLGAAAGFNQPVEIVRLKKLELLIRNVKEFFGELRGMDLQDLSESKLQAKLSQHSLTVDDLLSKYSEQPVEQ